MRRALYEQVHVVLAHMPLHDLNLQLRADVPHDLPQTDAYVRLQQFLAVFRDSHNVVFQVKSCVRRPPIMLHLLNVLKVVA